MGKSLTEIAQQLKDSNKKVQLIYAFNGIGKTRLSLEFKDLIAPKSDSNQDSELGGIKFLYYNAFTEDLFYWFKNPELDTELKLKIQPNNFTTWVLRDQGQDQNIIANFQHYTNTNVLPRFSEDFSEITFLLTDGSGSFENIKISKGEESNFVWCVFYSLLEQIFDVLNVAEPTERETNQFDQLEYVFIDDPESGQLQLRSVPLLLKSLFHNDLHTQTINKIFSTCSS